MTAKVLFVDDETNVLDGIRQNLRKANFQVITTSSLANAFDILSNDYVDIVVSDERMPMMSGHQFLTKVYEMYPKTVRMMLSGQASLSDVAIAVNDGKIYKYLSKPTQPKYLMEVIDEAIEVRQSLLAGSKNLQSATNDSMNLNELEKSCPGITKVHRDEEGFIIVDFKEDIEEKVKKQHTLSEALKQNQLTMHYQPLVDANTQSIQGYEALIRWRHPERGLLLPDNFLSLIKEEDLDAKVGYWVFKEVCKQKRIWLDQGHEDKTLSVNVSASYLEHPDFYQHVLGNLIEYDIKPDRINIEITEHYALNDLASTSETLKKLKSIGVHTTIDDFGMGFNSLSYLYELPLDILKIDRQFVAPIEKDPAAQSLVKALINMAHNLNLTVVAEGVENQTQSQLLSHWGCDLLQGYYYAPPKAASEIIYR